MQRLAFLLLAPPIAFLGTGACAHKVETAPVVATSAINDCALISAIGREHLKFSPADPARRIRLNGEDMAWTPGCDWKAMGFNLVDLTTPAAAGAPAPAQPDIEFRRPHYDSQGAEMRITLLASPGVETKELCRVKPSGERWEVAKCGPDPKINARKEDGPKPSDATPEKLPGAPSNRLPQAPIADTQTPG